MQIQLTLNQKARVLHHKLTFFLCERWL
jgi:hypothetical protein